MQVEMEMEDMASEQYGMFQATHVILFADILLVGQLLFRLIPSYNLCLILLGTALAEKGKKAEKKEDKLQAAHFRRKILFT
jgi:hypothetical protein